MKLMAVLLGKSFREAKLAPRPPPVDVDAWSDLGSCPLTASWVLA